MTEDPWTQVETIICRMLGSIHISLAVAVVVGGPTRFPAPNYNSLLDLTNHQVWPYGVLWFIGGLAMWVGRPWWRITGTAFIVFISSLWAGLFAIAAYQEPTAAYTPVAAYGGYALLNATMFWTLLMRWRESRELGGS